MLFHRHKWAIVDADPDLVRPARDDNFRRDYKLIPTPVTSVALQCGVCGDVKHRELVGRFRRLVHPLLTSHEQVGTP